MAAAGGGGGGGGGVVLVFDFDKTIIDCDSDNWVVEELGVNDLFAQLLPTLPWNCLMNRIMKELRNQGKTIKDITDCLKQIPVHPKIVSAIKLAHACGCDLRIVSDSNVLFIETVLKQNGLMGCFSEINTNPSYVDEEGKLRILQYHDCNKSSSSNGCTICPSNMCKGLVMEKLRTSVSADGGKRFIYVGDGTPDFCAALKLGGGDVLMARKNYPLWDLIYRNTVFIKSNVQDWSDGDELGSKLLNLINNNFSEDSCGTTVRLDHLGPVDCKLQTTSAPELDACTCNISVLQVPQ